ncbi:LIC11661 family lipoprotein [Leptospira sp. 'Mane']|uniref:LIC11661 family lipoprotein n=1 Tax=Leptospira sp. 'Mane' TaxID=3387407 RepID=UPI00398ABCE3
MIRILLFLVFTINSINCTNYTTSASNQAPPLLVSAVNNGNSNFTLKVRANNPEIIFQGYRLFQGNSESEARNPGDLNSGSDCTLQNGQVSVLINQPAEYTFEIDPVAAVSSSGVVCRFQRTVASGQYISLRAISLSLTTQTNSSSLRVSGPSNAIILP